MKQLEALVDDTVPLLKRIKTHRLETRETKMKYGRTLTFFFICVTPLEFVLRVLSASVC